jgi:ADP-ribose pyrophosphatase YjhB (NUDIX family)
MTFKDDLERLEAIFKVGPDGKVIKSSDLDKPTSDKPAKSWFGVPAGKSSKSSWSGQKPAKDDDSSKGVGSDGSSGLKPEKPEYKKPEKWISAGGVVLGGTDDLDHIYIRKPNGNFGPWAFAKGRIDKGETQEQAARREVEEEIGIVARIIPGGYLGLAEGSMSHTHYYLMVAVRDLKRHDDETEKVLLATYTEAIHKFAKGGNSRDIKILTKAMDLVEKIKRKRLASGDEKGWL